MNSSNETRPFHAAALRWRSAWDVAMSFIIAKARNATIPTLFVNHDLLEILLSANDEEFNCALGTMVLCRIEKVVYFNLTRLAILRPGILENHHEQDWNRFEKICETLGSSDGLKQTRFCSLGPFLDHILMRAFAVVARHAQRCKLFIFDDSQTDDFSDQAQYGRNSRRTIAPDLPAIADALRGLSCQELGVWLERPPSQYRDIVPLLQTL
jgi:hypothetical protein